MRNILNTTVLGISIYTKIQKRKLSDVVGYATQNGITLADSCLKTLNLAYTRPLFHIGAKEMNSNFATLHINWYASENQEEQAVKDFCFKPSLGIKGFSTARWDGWRTWEWMNRSAIKGLYFTSVSAALEGVKAHAKDKLYNSVRVLLDYTDYHTDATSFYVKMDSLVQLANQAGMTVLPALLTDKYASQEETALMQYVADVIKHYAQNDVIVAWDLYYRPGTGYKDSGKLSTFVSHLFESAREAAPQQPLFATAAVSVQNLDDNYIKATTHGSGYGDVGWYKFQYPTSGSTPELCYQICALSDVIGFSTTQQLPEASMLEGVAYRFGRPLFCTEWKPAVTETPDKLLSLFANMHTNWYVDGSIDDSYVQNFKFVPVTTEH